MKHTIRKFYFFTLFAVLFTATNCLGQIVAKGLDDSIEYRIAMINKEYSNINKDSAKYKITEEDILGHSTEGGELIKYFEGQILRKAVLTLYGETGQTTSEYYFMKGELIFIYKKNKKYQSPIYMGKTEIKSREENKFYFKNQKLIRWVDNDSKITDEFLYPEKEEQLLDELKIIF